MTLKNKLTEKTIRGMTTMKRTLIFNGGIRYAPNSLPFFTRSVIIVATLYILVDIQLVFDTPREDSEHGWGQSWCETSCRFIHTEIYGYLHKSSILNFRLRAQWLFDLSCSSTSRISRAYSIDNCYELSRYCQLKDANDFSAFDNIEEESF